MSDIIDINVNKIVEEVTINVVDNLITVNINKVTGGGGGTQTLAQTLDLGNTTGGENISISNGDAIILDNGSMLKKGTIDAGNGGSKGISQICGLGFEHKWEAGRLYIMNDGGTIIREVSHNLTYTPTATDDVTKGFVQNTRWILDNGDVYLCTDPTEGAAVWELFEGELRAGAFIVRQEGFDYIGLGSVSPQRYGLYNADGNFVIADIDFTNTLNQVYRFGGSAVDGEEFIRLDNDSFLYNGVQVATLDDISTPSLNDVTIVGNTSNQSIIVQEAGVSNIEINTNSIIKNDFENDGYLQLTFPALDTNQSQQFQDATGTIALTSDIPAAQVNSDWNATSGLAEILNKPTIPINTSQLNNDGANGVNPFITALDIPTTGQASTLVREVKNMTGATLTKGTVVYISGANGNKPLVSKALATTDALSSRTFGLLQSNISNNGLGNCVIIGDLSGLDTSAFTEGAQLYLSGVTAGTYTDTKILAPTHLVYVGKVTRSHPTQGQIEVGIQNGYELEEIHDCQIITPLDNQALTYESSTDLWKNKTIIEDSITDGVTTIAPSQNAVFDALALKQNVVSGVSDTEIGYLDGVTSAIQTQLNARCVKLYNLTSQITHTGTTAKTLLLTYFIPANTFTNGDFLNFSAMVTKVANIGNTTHTIEINTTNTLSGATIITTAGFNTTNSSMKLKREIALNGGNGYVLNISAATQNDQTIGAIPNAMSTFTYNLAADLYLFVTCQLNNATDSITYRGVSITKN